MLEVMGDAERLSLQFNRERWVAILTQLMGLLALALSSVGLCGVVKLLVARRTAEIGLRIPLGVANTESRMIVGAAIGLLLAGIAIGPRSPWPARD